MMLRKVRTGSAQTFPYPFNLWVYHLPHTTKPTYRTAGRQGLEPFHIRPHQDRILDISHQSP